MVAPSMAELKKEEKLIMLANWQDSWKDSTGGAILKEVKQEVNLHMLSWGDYPRSDEVIFRCGFGKSLYSYLKSIGKHPDGRCDICYVLDDVNVKHFLLECKKYAYERNYLKQRLEENNQIMTLKFLLDGIRTPFKEVIWFVKKCKREI